MFSHMAPHFILPKYGNLAIFQVQVPALTLGKFLY